MHATVKASNFIIYPTFLAAISDELYYKEYYYSEFEEHSIALVVSYVSKIILKIIKIPS